MKTKKLITRLSALCLFAFTSLAYGQESNTNSNLPSNTNAFGKGTNVLGIGIGVGGDYTYIGDGYSVSPNIILTYDNGTFGNVGPGTISLGGLLSYKGVSYNYVDPYSGYFYKQSWAYYIIGFRSAYHWNFTTSNRFDPYLGLMLAYNDVSYSTSSNDPDFHAPGNPYYYYYTDTYSSYLALSLYLGARYYVSNSVGIWLELGTGYTNAALGICFKF